MPEDPVTHVSVSPPASSGRTRTSAVAAIVVLVCTTAAACGGEQAATTVAGDTAPASAPGSAPASAPGSAPASAPGSAPASAPGSAFCDRAEEFNQVLASVDANSVDSFDVIAAELSALSTVAPAEAAAHHATMSGYWNRLAAVDTNDPTQVAQLTERSEEVVVAGQRVTAYLVDECGITPVE